MARFHDLHLIVDVDLVFPKLTGLPYKVYVPTADT